MAEQLKEIEIPFGTKDSELCGWEYSIPEGMEATIVDNKIVVKKKESGDEKIRKELIQYLKECINLPSGQYCRADFFNWLEKQGQTFTKKDVDDTYLKGISDAKHELEKQGENSPILSNSSNIGKNELNTAWGKEDKRKINRIYSILGQAADTHAFSTTCRLIGDKECIELQDFLKSLRP